MQTLRLTLPGIPRTKKNSQRIVPRGKHHIPLPSEAWKTWAAALVPKLKAWMAQNRQQPIAHPVNCRALFYRDALRGDAVGFYQGLADLLQKAGVLVDDKYVTQWDGSRLLKDAARPRVEVTLTRIEKGA